ncbi:Cytochrome P450 2J2 [Hypsibius exemplaris]|uniref:Cytochrome P450 2J2 n=1 Tax=Hypsibius exemplaris TaxID=2072580 RepID=A0A1W0X686_HYPEX|nr:Cytochrome P450 2J2 [Hypsibius exemplaris]
MELLSATFTFLTTILALVYIWAKLYRPKNYPPGPLVIPYLGNLLSFGKQPHIALLKWKEQYGDIYSVYCGRKRIVVLSNFNTLRKVFGDDVSAGRDAHSAIRIDYSTGANMGLVFSQGDLWKTHRRFALSTLRDLGMGKNWLEDTILTEVESICQTLRDTQQQPFDPKVQLTNSVSNVICALIFGKRFPLTDPKFSQLTNMVAEYVDSLGVEPLVKALPFLMWFPNPFRRKTLRARINTVALLEFFKEQADLHDGSVEKQTDAQDYLYAYQAEKEKQTGQTLFHAQQLLASLSDLFAAGTETTSTTTLWAFVFFLENPEIMRKVQEEIDNNTGRERMLTNADRGMLPYTEAVILEVQRCASLVPLAVPHSSREDMTIDGYTIPKDTLLIGNLFSIHRDPRLWENPDQFNPLRFLDENMKLTRPDGFAPFSIGKRACLGEALAKMELFLFIANLLRCFTLELPRVLDFTYFPTFRWLKCRNRIQKLRPLRKVRTTSIWIDWQLKSFFEMLKRTPRVPNHMARPPGKKDPYLNRI